MIWGSWGSLLSIAASWLLTYALHSTLFLGATWVITRYVRSAEWRDLLWKVALVGGLVTTTIQSMAGFAPLLGRIPLFSSGDGVFFEAPFLVNLIESQTTAAVIVSVWVVGVAVQLIAFIRTKRGLDRCMSRRVAVSNPSLVALMQDLSLHAGLRKPVGLATHDNLSGPITLSCHEVVIPERVLGLPWGQLKGILAHEVLHAKRRDACLFTCGFCLEHVLFFQPLLRVARQEIRDAAEFLCDDWAAEQVDQVTVARGLVEVASWRVPTSRASALVARLVPGEGALDRRIRKLIEGPRVRELALWRQWVAALVVWGFMTVLAPVFSAGSGDVLPGLTDPTPQAASNLAENTYVPPPAD